MAKLAKNRLNSTWTPLNNEDLNHKSLSESSGKSSNVDPLRSIFNERRALVSKWFDKWTDSQRMMVLEDLVGRCKIKQLEQATAAIAKRKPTLHDDFTRSMPRVLSLYVFSYLDPRSLCRCSQVCWNWKWLTELDQLWMKKCLRLGWILTFTPTPYESGMWKRLYIENITALKNSLPAISKSINLKELEKMAILSKGDGMTSSRSRCSTSMAGKKPPWKGSDPTPKDTWRNNYLENDDEIEKVNKLRKRGVYGTEADELQRRARIKVNSGMHQLKRSNSFSRPKSVATNSPETPMPSERPNWATSDTFATPGDIDPRTANRHVRIDPSARAGIIKSITSQRSARDPPSTELFPSKPWTAPNDDEEEYDSEVY